jgi:hypothetical protein
MLKIISLLFCGKEINYCMTNPIKHERVEDRPKPILPPQKYPKG